MQHQILNEHIDLSKVMFIKWETMNPFDANVDPDRLYNNGTGITANDLANRFWLNIFRNVKKA